MKWKLFGIIGTVLIASATLGFETQSAWATGEDEGPSVTSTNSCGGDFLGFKPWYDGLCEGGEIKTINKGDEQALTQFVWRIVLNVIFDLTLAIGYIAVAMVIYGGYLYMMSQGDPGKAAKGKKTLTSAIIGVVIAIGASVIVNTVINILDINTSGGWEQGEFTQEKVANIFSWAYLMAGLVAVIFIIKSGVDYMLATGDPGKISKATHSIIFSIVGLIIVIAAAVITNFVVSSIGGAI